jgi:hypothetical protein
MPITQVPAPPLRSQGKSQEQYSSEFETFMTGFYQSVVDWNAASTAYQLSVTTTSSTSNAIGTGSKTFTVAAGGGFYVGMAIRAANSATNHMTGEVASYAGTSLVINVTGIAGTGTFTAWVIGPAAVGANSAGSVSFTPTGNIAAVNVQSAIQELDTEKLSSAAGAVTGTNLQAITTAETVGTSFSIPVITKDINGRITSATTAAKIVSGTAIATTSGTSHDFTGIQSGFKRITVMFNGVSTIGTSFLLIQIGSGSIQTTGYLSTATFPSGGGSTGSQNSTAGFVFGGNASANIVSGQMVLTLFNGNTWLASHSGSVSITQSMCGGGSVSLAGILDRIRLTTVNGTDTFDAGSVNILVE